MSRAADMLHELARNGHRTSLSELFVATIPLLQFNLF